MKGALDRCTWPAAQLGDALDAIGRHTRLAVSEAPLPNPPPSVTFGDGGLLDQWLAQMTAAAGFDAEPVDTPVSELGRCLGTAAPAIMRLPCNPQAFLLVVRSTRRRVRVLCPDLALRDVHVDDVAAALRKPLETPLVSELEAIVDAADLQGSARARALRALMDERLGPVRVDGCWILRPAAGSSLWAQARRARLPRRIATILASHVIVYALVLLSWWLIGVGAMTDQLDSGLLLAWALVLLTVVPFRLMSTRASGLLAIQAGSLVKQRLLHGALTLDPEEIKHQGAGQLLSRVIESDAVESLALTGGVLGLTACIELAFAAVVLALGAGGWPQTASLAGWLALTAGVFWLYLRRRRTWTDARLAMTHDLVERMVGHRTRLAQENPSRWHHEEDGLLDRYVEVSAAMDRAAVVQAILPRGWLIVGLAGLAPAFVAGGASAAPIAVGLGGVVLAYRALLRLVPVITHLAGALIAAREVEPLLGRGKEEVPLASQFERIHLSAASDRGVSIIDARDLSYRYPHRTQSVLRGCSLRIIRGDRILLEGGSGGGKSTLGSILAGLRTPDSGLLLLGGLDRRSLGLRGWRRRVVAAPQFHENHIFVGSLAFNLLMGRGWPPGRRDLRAADEVCRALGLGDLIERMPGGMLQMVGDMGWQLSHGEKSRVYIARTLLQDASLIILDESFAALDPKTLRTCVEAVRARASSLLVIAHP